MGVAGCASEGETDDVQSNPRDGASVADEAGSASTDPVPAQASSAVVSAEMENAGANADDTLGADPVEGSDEAPLEDSGGSDGADLNDSSDPTLPGADAADSDPATDAAPGDPVSDPLTDPGNVDDADSSADAGDVPSDPSDPPLCENERGSCHLEGDSVRCSCVNGHEALDRTEECVPDICTHRLEAICQEPDAPCDPEGLTLACFEQLSDEYDCSASAEHFGQTVVGGCTWSDEFESYYCSCAFGVSGTARGPVDGDCEEALQSFCFRPPPEDDCSVRSTSPSGIPIRGTCNAVSEGARTFRCVCEWGGCDDFSYTLADVRGDSCEEIVQAYCSAEAQGIP